MDTSKLKKFAQYARRQLMEQVTAKLKLVLAEDSPARRESPEAVAKLEERIREKSGQGPVARGQKGKTLTTENWSLIAEEVAYTWFNRFCALRFMDVNRYNRIGVVSPADGQFQPEILAEAKMGYVDEDMVPEQIRQQIFALLDGSAPSPEPQAEAYRLLVVAVCNDYHRIMPYLFERIDDYTELLMPDDLLSENSILARMREAIRKEVASNEWRVASSEKVVSNEWRVASSEKDELVTNYSSLATNSEEPLDVEIIGWLYQFYISEKKDEVFAALKKNKKITPENIPAATQLFTPHWIVRYLVENSLGRLWMLNRPQSKLIDRMDYYIKPEGSNEQGVMSNEQGVMSNEQGVMSNEHGVMSNEQGVMSNEQGELITHYSLLSTDYLKISSPEEIKICDPACGSGHMLTYAFDLLYAIYEEEGYQPTEIPEKILTQNLYGIEIDERAGTLAAFALTMKARAWQKRFFRKLVQPNICVLEPIRFEDGELKDYLDFVGRDLFTEPLRETLHQFKEADNFGSLIRPAVTDVGDVLALLEERDVGGQLFLHQTHQKVLRVLRQADYLSPKYHIAIANPPYMGERNMNSRLGVWIKDNYPNSKADLFSVFIERNLHLTAKHGFVTMITMQSWMFLSSYEKIRSLILSNSIGSMIHIGYNTFPELNTKVAQGTAFVILKSSKDWPGIYYNLNDAEPSSDKEQVFLTKLSSQDFYKVNVSTLKLIPGSPISYWMPEQLRDSFATKRPLKETGDTRQGMATSDNDRFLKLWHEVSYERIAFNCKNGADNSHVIWVPYNKGGETRKWWGNQEWIVYWKDNGADVVGYARDKYGSPTRTIKSMSEYFKPSISWSKVSWLSAFRYFPSGFIFDVAGCSVFLKKTSDLKVLLSFLNSKVAEVMLNAISPTLNYEAGHVARLPFEMPVESVQLETLTIADNLVKISKDDWDSQENSWEFKCHPLIDAESDELLIERSWKKLKDLYAEKTSAALILEKNNDEVWNDFFAATGVLSSRSAVSSSVTLFANPLYRYGGNKTEEELEALLLADTMRELVSYAVGCMFGRYALDKPGLILANQGDTIDDYLKQIPEPRFPADDDNVIPILDGDWFVDDIAERFRKFLRVAFSEEHYEENLKFVEQGLNIKGKRNYSIRDYFLSEFYTDHIKRYKKRPIYWLFSSPKGTFNALIYMHRYRPDTVSVVLNDYLREFRTKLTAEKSHQERVSISESASASDKTRALRQIENLNKMIEELEDYEREVLYPLATEQVEIDLDDGVKVNYGKFGKALKKVSGLN